MKKTREELEKECADLTVSGYFKQDAAGKMMKVLEAEAITKPRSMT